MKRISNTTEENVTVGIFLEGLGFPEMSIQTR
jgi:hypothetical protein